MIAEIPRDRESTSAIETFQRKVQSHHSAAQQIELLSQTVITLLDRRAEAIVRQASARAFGITAMSPTAITNIGDFQIALGEIPKSMSFIEEQAIGLNHLIALGGDHSVTLPLLRAAAKSRGPLALIHFDAHVDTWPDNFGQPYAHGSVFFHAIEERLIDPRRAVQIGIRSPVQKDVYDWTVAKGVTIISAQELHEFGPSIITERAMAIVGDTPVYLSFDIDVLDPAFAPGTGTPEIGGLATWQVQSILRRLGKLHFVGMDVVEVAPPYDVAEITALAAATIVWEYLALIGSA